MDHLKANKHKATIDSFEIVRPVVDKSELNIVESLVIKYNKPNLNVDVASTPLLIA